MAWRNPAGHIKGRNVQANDLLLVHQQANTDFYRCLSGWQGDRNAEKRWLLERQYAARAGRKAGYPHNVPLRQFRQRPGRL